METNNRILVSTPEMEATIQKYENARSTLQEAFSKLESAKNHLDNCYKGLAYMALSAKWSNVNSNVRSAEIAIDESVNGLRKTVAEMLNAEEDINGGYDSMEIGQAPTSFLND